MRFMELKPFSRRGAFPDFDKFMRGRLTEGRVAWPEQAISLVSFMAWPEDPENRRSLRDQLQRQLDNLDNDRPPLHVKAIQTEWARTADIFQRHYELALGLHAAARGGASIGKSITVVSKTLRGRVNGVGEARLWQIWSSYKNVAHLIAALFALTAHCNIRFGLEPTLGPLSPFRLAMLMPDFVVGVALFYQRHGLNYLCPHDSKPPLDAALLWRIPENINVEPVRPPLGRLTRPQQLHLRARRAGNRGRITRREDRKLEA
jgi:hypothetical protein